MSVIVFAAIFVFSALAALIATGVLLPILRRCKVFDLPNERSSHERPIPSGGGIALVFVAVTIWLAVSYDVFDWFQIMESDQNVKWVTGGTVFLALVSWVDDIKGLNPLIRLASQLGTVIGVMILLPEPLVLFNGIIPGWLDQVIIVFLWIWFINLFNFMDGIDGLAGIETGAIGLGVFFIATYTSIGGTLAILALTLSAVGIGFLVWNWAPAKIFMGDVGSVPIGFLLAWLLLTLAQKGYMLQALIIPAYYLADATVTLVRRASRGEKIWLPHRDHYYQQAVQRGLGHARVSVVVAGLNAFLIGLALLSLWSEVGGLLGGLVVTALVLFYMRGKKRI
jgi:UDP-N-acetylmuramyl pentapeptide phosphotransferase/UDP-N-acetylglucosamine-1-phosphate transferase